MKDLTLVIPAKNESESLPMVLEELKKYECNKIIILDKDDLKTLDAIKEFNCKIIFQPGKGYGNAIIEGINNVETKYLSIYYADGSTNIKEMPRMLEKLISEDLDILFGSRYLPEAGTKDDGIVTYTGNKIFTLICNLLFRIKISDVLLFPSSLKLVSLFITILTVNPN